MSQLQAIKWGRWQGLPNALALCGGDPCAIAALKYSMEGMLDVGCLSDRCLRRLVVRAQRSGAGRCDSHMRELRIQSHGDPLRVFYAFDPRRSAVLVIGGNKSGKDKRFYKTMIPKADTLYDEHLNNLKTQSES
jgi:hypothetical protein